MKEQSYCIKIKDSFELKDIFECGQCFRWNEESDGSYTGVITEGVLNVVKNNKEIVFTGVLKGDIKEICNKYFDLETDYSQIKQELSKIDEYLKSSIEYGEGIRILHQDLWECIISFIISANNNIPRIKGIIERISKKYGKQLEWRKNTYFLFPTPEELKEASVDDLRSLGLGFRDKRVYRTTQMIINKEIDLEKLKQSNNSLKIKEQLLTLDGVGEKVADCIMLFSLKRFDVFPVDVWVRRVMNELYIKNEEEAKVKNEEIRKLAENKFHDLAGIAQQYLFYARRNSEKENKVS